MAGEDNLAPIAPGGDSFAMIAAADPDLMHRFLLERAGVRGAIVRLDQAWETVTRQADYPGGLAGFLGEALAASALFTSHIKSGTGLAIQLRAGGPLTSLYAECSSEGEVRGLAHWRGEVPDPLTLGHLRAPAHLAITLEQRNGQRYQGMVPLESGTLDGAFEAYFARSEQLPTRVRLAADRRHSAGIMLQHLPDEGGQASAADPDGWNRACVLLDTLAREELLTVDAAMLLRRLFHEEDVRLFPPRGLGFGCRCSSARVEQMLRHLGREETQAVIAEQGQIEVTCEFCNRRYRFDRVDLERIHSDSSVPGTQTRQ
jgi:molecular chaperone Hsp33